MSVFAGERSETEEAILTIEMGAIVLVEWEGSGGADFMSPAGPIAEALLIHNGRPHWVLRSTTGATADGEPKMIPSAPETIPEGCLALLAVHFVKDDAIRSIVDGFRNDPGFFVLDGLDSSRLESVHRAAREACVGLVLTVYEGGGDSLARDLAEACPGASVMVLRASPVG